MNNINPTFIVVDLFCGFGGTTLGFEKSGVAKVIACVNHDPKAIKSHWLNHPEVKHFEEDIRTLDLTELVQHVAIQLALYPSAKLILWASLECTNFSKAKGGQPRDADSRTLADHLERYIMAIDPDYIMIENVVEFMSWGPLDENGKPISKKNGSDWLRWRKALCAMGYKDDWKELNSANFGAYTSRNRLFGVFAKYELPIAWPSPTHAKKPSNDIFGGLQKWKPVKEVLDFEDEGQSIFGRKKEMSPKTLEVIYKGMKKAIAEGNDSILFKYYGNGDNLNSIEQPAGTITTKDRFAKLAFIFRQYKTGFTSSINEPVGALPTNPKADLVSFIMNKSHGGHTTSTDSPSPVIVARQDKAPLYLIQVFMDENGIKDIMHRMLKVPELLLIQGFPIDYQMVGNQADCKKCIGNSVQPDVPKHQAIALHDALLFWPTYSKSTSLPL
jgi:DNA (cytosine-5)-methyltransferase 1